jgi:peptidyl-tRNA hydrolase, PTH1 family
MAWLVAGLGNPGEAYARTRHNAGRMTLDVLAQAHRARLKKARFLPADVAEIHIGSNPVWLVTSTRFMNESGPAYASFAAKHAIEPDHVIAVHDELEIPAGELMLKFGGGSGGHNGLRSLTQALGTPSYLRVRIGIGRPPGRQAPAEFVLQPLGKDGALDLAVSVGRAADAVEALVSEGLEPAQQRFNRGATSG